MSFFYCLIKIYIFSVSFGDMSMKILKKNYFNISTNKKSIYESHTFKKNEMVFFRKKIISGKILAIGLT